MNDFHAWRAPAPDACAERFAPGENCTPQLSEDHTMLTLTFIYLLEQLGGEVVVPHSALDWARYGTFSTTPVEDGLRLAFKEKEWAV